MEIYSALDVAHVVRAARRRRRMSQADLAATAGVSRRWLVDLEAGKPRAELSLVLTVLATLGVPLRAGAGDGESLLPVVEPAVTEVAGTQPAGGVDLDAHLRRFLGER